jgi:alkylation response protein AidB-like acyl-CoA dehydrogenase
MRISKVEFKKSQPIEFNEEIAMLNLASQMVGGAEAVLNLSVEYAKNRIAFGKPI